MGPSKPRRLRHKNEEPWLVLAAVASPKASINYLQEALQINPNSERAHKGMRWALSRQEKTQTQPSTPAPTPIVAPQPKRTIVTPIASPRDQVQQRSILVPWMAAAVFCSLNNRRLV